MKPKKLDHNKLSANLGSRIRGRVAANALAKYPALRPAELLEATKEFDREMVVTKSRPLSQAERDAWEKARRKPGRPRKGAGAKVISVSVERGLLSRADLLARALGVSRASLIERGLKAVLGSAGRG
jgi:hypothetical protein